MKSSNPLAIVLVTLLVVAVLGLGGFVYMKKDTLFGDGSSTPSGGSESGQVTYAETSGILVDASEQGVVDWEEGTILVTGVGVATTEGASSIAGRRRAAGLMAQNDAYAKMGAIVGRVRVRQSVEAGIEDLRSLTSETQINETVRKAIPGQSEYTQYEDGSVEVKQQYTLYIRDLPRPTPDRVPPRPRADREDIPEKAKKDAEDREEQDAQEGPYTGIIINAEGLGVRPGLAPEITIEGQNAVVYQYTDASDEAYNEKGLVGYARSVDAARRIRDRAGANPIVLPASEANGTAVVVTAEVAARIMQADPGGELRRSCKVIFVTG